MNPFIKRLGGKFYLKNILLELFPKKLDDYIEPFCGGGSVFLNLEKYNIIVKGTTYLNDLDGNIANVWQCFIDENLSEQLLSKLETFAIYDEGIFELLKESQPTSIVDCAFKTLVLTMMSFEGNMKSYYIGIGDIGRRNAKIYQPKEYWDRYIKYIRKYNVKGSQKNYDKFLQKSFNRSTSFVYLDPPYDDTRGYDNLPFNKDDHLTLKNLLVDFQGSFMLSINNTEYIRELYKNTPFHIYLLHTRWTANAKSDKNSEGVDELIITNYSFPSTTNNEILSKLTQLQ